jgi:PAS domain S-box-containing protein
VLATPTDFEAAFEALPGNVLLLLPDAPTYTVAGISTELLALLGLPRAAVLGQGVAALFAGPPPAAPAAGLAALRATLGRALHLRAPAELPPTCFEAADPAGAYAARYWAGHTRPVLAPEGPVRYLLHTATVVPAPEADSPPAPALPGLPLLHKLLLQAPVALCLVGGPQHQILLANGALHQLLGTTAAIVGQPLRQAVRRPRLQGLAELLDQARATGAPAFAAECVLLPPHRGAAAPRYYNLVAEPYYLSPTEAHPSGIVAIAYEVTAQVLARQAARTTQGYYHTLLEESPVATALYLGPDCCIEYANPLMLRFWGRTSGVLGLPFAEALPELVGQAFPERLRQVYATGQAYAGTQEPATLLVEGTPRTAYYTFTYQPLRTPEGTIYGVHHTATDVTAEVLAARQMAESERRFRALVEQAPVAITLTRGPEVVIESINAPMLRIMGKATAAEVLGRPMREVLPHLASQAILRIGQAVAETGQPYYGSEVPVAMLGPGMVLEERYFNLSYTPLLENDRPDGLIQVAVDVTEQVRARQQVEASRAALAESEERFRIVADAAPVMMWAVNPTAGTRYVNRAFLEFLDLTLAEYLKTSWLAYVHPDDIEASEALMRLSASERHRYTHEFRVRRHDGQYRWLRAQGASCYYPNSEPYGYVGAAIDITDLKVANERLARANTDLDNFIYTASHDLKAPITNIEGLLAMLERVLPPATRVGHTDKVLALMRDSVARFRRTLRELAEIGRLQQTPDQEATLVNLPALLDEVCLDLDPQLRHSGAQVVRELLDCPRIRFSARNLRSILYNLLGNALKYRAPARPPVVEVACRATPQHYVLVVRDNGLGFAPERAEEIFGMYQRLHDHVEGSGVGLYLVRRMLENTGGRIEAQGEPGVGATFTVYFAR